MMLSVTQDGEAIFASAIEIASPQERAAFIAQACGSDAVLRQRIEERVAAHVHARNGLAQPKAEAPNGAAASPSHHAANGSAPQHQPVVVAEQKQAPEPRKASTLLTRLLAVSTLAALAAGIGLSYWAVRTRGEAEKAMQQVAEERERIRKNEEESRHEREEMEKARQELARERDQAVVEEKAAESAAEDMKAVVEFWQQKVLSPGRPVGWTGGLGKAVTLRQAVDAAETRIAQAFKDRPLAEATIREILGSTYLDLEEAARAVRQYERALTLRKARQGENHSDTIACRNQLAAAYRLADRPDDASRLFNANRDSAANAASGSAKTRQ